MTTRAVVYARVSTEEQAQHGYSIDAQKQVVKQYCTMQGKVLVDAYVDAGLSGKEMSKRKGLQQLLLDAKNGKFDEVVVWKINRISRSTKDLLNIVDKLKSVNVGFTSITENFDTTSPAGNFLLQLLGATAELERNTIADNVRMGLKQRARMGLHSGGRVLGYKPVPSTKPGRAGKNDLAIIPEEAEIVREIFRLFSEGMGFKAIAYHLNRSGFRTWKGNPFSSKAIKGIIDNPVYKGDIRYCRYEHWSERRRKGKNPNPIIAKGAHEAIIDEETWNKVVSIRNIRNNTAAKVRDDSNFLTGILRCPQCGAPMTIAYSSTKLKSAELRRYRFYVCSQFKEKGTTVCHGNSVRAVAAEACVLDKIKHTLSQTALVQKLVDKVQKKLVEASKGKSVNIEQLDKEILDLQQRKNKLLDLYVEGMIDKSLLNSRVAELDLKLKELNSDKASCMGKKATKFTVSKEYLDAILANIDKVMSSVNHQQQQLLMKMLLDKVTVVDHKVDKIYLKLNMFDEKGLAAQAAKPSLFYQLSVGKEVEQVIIEI